jgi:nucleoside-triphosphatase THEP1
MLSKPKKTVLVTGSVGVGKSNFGNFFLDGRASNRFPSGNSCVSGLTTEIRMGESCALGNPAN